MVTTNFLHIITLINRAYARSELVEKRGGQRIVLKTFTTESEARIYLTDFLRRLNHEQIGRHREEIAGCTDD